MPPQVSVLMPVRNGMPWVPSAIESILTQSYSDFELLVVDDGSTDSTPERLESLSAKDPRILVLRQGAEGSRHALNRCIKAAKGIFLARMDADDIAEASRFQLQVEFLKRHPEVVAVGGQNRAIDSDGDILFNIHYPTCPLEIKETLWKGQNCLSHPTMMLRKSAVVAAGGYMEEYPTDDYGLWLRLTKIGAIANLPEFLLRYRVHPLVSSITKHEQQCRAARAILTEACLRHGTPFPSQFIDLSQNAPKTVPRIHHHWAMSAVRDGYWKSGRKHAWQAIVQEPTNAHAWWTLLKSVIHLRSLRKVAR